MHNRLSHPLEHYFTAMLGSERPPDPPTFFRHFVRELQEGRQHPTGRSSLCPNKYWGWWDLRILKLCAVDVGRHSIERQYSDRDRHQCNLLSAKASYLHSPLRH